MAIIFHDSMTGTSSPAVGRTPDTVDNGNTWALPTNEDCVTAVGSGYLTMSGLGSSETSINSIVCDAETADVQVTGRFSSTSTAASNRYVGIAFRVSTETDMIQVGISHVDNRLIAIKLETGQVASVLDLVNITIGDGTQYDLYGRFDGDDLYVELRNTSGTVLATISTTSSFNNTVTNHGVSFGLIDSSNQRCYDFLCEDPEYAVPSTDLTGQKRGRGSKTYDRPWLNRGARRQIRRSISQLR